MNPPREKVLVLGDGVSAFLAVIRSLGRRGIDVHVAWCRSDGAALRSRYVKKVHRLAFFDPDELWIGQLEALLARERFDLVIPCNEQSMRALHAGRQRFERHARLCLVDEAIFETVFDKRACGELAERLGMRVPRTRLIDDAAQWEGTAAALSFPLVLKPASSYDTRRPLSRRNVTKAYDVQQLELLARRMLREGQVIAQENFIGRGVGVELLVDRGQVLIAFQHQRVHQPPQGGASSYRRSVPLSKDLLEASKRFVAELNFTGAIMLEFLVNDQQDWRFVEANARFWGSLPLAVAAGADFPWALYQLLVHGQRASQPNYRVGLYCRSPLADARWFVENLRADRTDRTLATCSPLSVLGEARHWLLGRERFDTFTLDDPLPAFAEPWAYARRAAARLAMESRGVLASLPGVRQMQSASARRKLGSARKVVFLCWGNICRSPFAADYARRVWPADVHIESRGLHFQDGRKSPAEAIEAARSFDVDLTNHRSTIISRGEVTSADLIISFDEEIRHRLLAEFPEAAPKLARFGLLASSGPVKVGDPFGGDLAAFQRAYTRIAATLDASRTVFGPSRDVALRTGPARPIPEVQRQST